MFHLKLLKPLAFIDVETTGLDSRNDRIIELSILKIHPDNREEYCSHRINPEIPIPPEAVAVHHITDHDVAHEPTFLQYARSIHEFLEGCDIAGFNVIKFDLPFLEEEFKRAKVVFSRQGRQFIDSQVIYHRYEPRNLETAYRLYCGKELTNAHCAEDDARAAAEILEGQLTKYQDLPRDTASLSFLCYGNGADYIDADGKFVWVEGEPVCNFGKQYKGRSLKDIAAKDPGYLRWITSAGFSNEVKEIAIKALNGQFPEQHLGIQL